MTSLVLTDSSQLTSDAFEKLPGQILYPYAEPYDLQKHVFSSFYHYKQAGPANTLPVHTLPACFNLPASPYSSPMTSLVLTDRSQLTALKSYQTKLCIPTPNQMICKNMCAKNGQREKGIIRADPIWKQAEFRALPTQANTTREAWQQETPLSPNLNIFLEGMLAVSDPIQPRSELVCRVKYCNTLPDIPFDPKFITYPFDSTRFIQYNPTSLERSYKYEVLTEHDLGVTIDLINKDTYINDHGAQLDPADEKLLEEDILTPQDSKRSRHHARSVSWLRRTEYISTEQTRFQPQTMDKVEAKVGYSIKKNFKEETIYMDRESQIKAINKTFEDSKIPIEKHYSKPNVTPVEVFSVFPDFKVWKYPCAQVIFDSDPAPTGRPVPAQIEEMSQAMIRGVMDESGEQFVAYFLPMEDTLEKRRRDFVNMVDYEDEEEYNYKMSREYNWNVKSKASKGYEENYFLVMRQDGVFYNELETRVRLSKRRQKVGQPPNNTRLVVRHRPLNAQEFRMQRYRERMLEPTGEEEEEGSGEEGEDKSGLQMLADEDPVVERNARVHRTVMEGLTCYQEIYKEKKCAAKQPTIRAFFQPVAAMVTHEGDKIISEKDASEDEKQNDQDKEDDDASGKEKSDSDQGGSGSEEERLTSKTSRSPSRSRSTSKSPPRSRSRSKSKSRSRSRSSSAASNKSASGSGSASASESGSESDK
uniref:RNA polymerase II-associated factor 1 homolog n=2 Tax=Timema TaxID=61471 RepID=A0A7R9EE17_9NEOP|nr:unnamed protein product [Timema monikensis]